MRIVVVRLSHRKKRDQRVSTHVALVARAFGAEGIFYSGEKDKSLEESVKKVVENWGGEFWIRYEKSWRKLLKELKEKGFYLIHLTMYGININDALKTIPKKDLALIVGSEKVPGEVFKLADLNLAIGNQPHSEVAALAIFLDRFFKGRELERKFKDAKIEVVPQEKGKKVIKRQET